MNNQEPKDPEAFEVTLKDGRKVMVMPEDTAAKLHARGKSPELLELQRKLAEMSVEDRAAVANSLVGFIKQSTKKKPVPGAVASRRSKRSKANKAARAARKKNRRK